MHATCALSGAPCRRAAGDALQAVPVAHHGELAAVAARIALVGREPRSARSRYRGIAACGAGRVRYDATRIQTNIALVAYASSFRRLRAAAAYWDLTQAPAVLLVNRLQST